MPAFQKVALTALMYFLIGVAVAAHADAPSAIAADPAPDTNYLPKMEAFSIVSRGESMNAVLYTASGRGPHPTVLLLHGLPGNEQNLDLAQTIRRDGWNVLTFHYRGSWGSHGAFSLSHAIEDTAAAVAFLRDPKSIEKYAIDPKRLVVIGHSMGGLMAAKTAADDDGINGVILISAANMGPYLATLRSPNVRKASLEDFAADLPPLGGATVESLLRDSVGHDTDWDFTTYARALKTRPMLILTADDGLAAPNERLVQRLRMEGSMDVQLVHTATDHSFSDHRIALETLIIDWLRTHFRSTR